MEHFRENLEIVTKKRSLLFKKLRFQGGKLINFVVVYLKIFPKKMISTLWVGLTPAKITIN